MIKKNRKRAVREADQRIARPESHPDLTGLGDLPDADGRQADKRARGQSEQGAEDIQPRQGVPERQPDREDGSCAHGDQEGKRVDAAVAVGDEANAESSYAGAPVVAIVRSVGEEKKKKYWKKGSTDTLRTESKTILVLELNPCMTI